MLNVTNLLESHQPFKRSMANNSNKRKELSNATDRWLSRALPNPSPLFSLALVKNKDFRKVFVINGKINLGKRHHFLNVISKPLLSFSSFVNF